MQKNFIAERIIKFPNTTLKADVQDKGTSDVIIYW